MSQQLQSSMSKHRNRYLCAQVYMNKNVQSPYSLEPKIGNNQMSLNSRKDKLIMA